MTDDIYTMLIELIGTPPVGYEYTVYIGAVIICIFFVFCLMKIFISVFNVLLGK